MTITATRIEVLAEAVENLALGIASKMVARAKDTEPRPMVDDFVASARQQLRDALKEFLSPMLRLIDNGPRQHDTENRAMCAECNRHFICADSNCPHWHKAIRIAVAGTTTEDDRGDAA